MDKSVLLAKFWGFYLITFGIIFLVSPKSLNKLFGFIDDEKFLFILGFIAFSMGLVNILLHNIWVTDWRVIITLFGWIALLKGILRIAMTGGVSNMLKSMNTKGIRWLLLPVFGLGIYLLYCAYFLA